MKRLASLLLISLGASSAWAANLSINFPVSEDGRHQFFQELLVESLKAAGHNVSLNGVDIPRHKRSYLFLESGKIDLLWMLPSAERDARFTRINQPLTRGLIGTRILLIPPGEESRFASINSLEDFKRTGMVGGFGGGWVDIAIWKANGLPTYEHNGEWNDLFRLVASKMRGIDYFPRGANEIGREAAMHSNLIIEPRLMLTYPADFHYYIARNRRDLIDALNTALPQAMKNGVYDRLYKQHLEPIARSLNLSERRNIKLELPAS
ncbi:type 2 periplasmic-binding domain-containing protein [Parachitinimonas caeni]|uniref:Solute-binding protein family 3/N-terminal domain-containing protein n=1 Tax=Parachitinimonas caeni TaxID=3031301 RepID=A0ABT7DVX0_9NEIS|nr:hypothetical protein [Parachitinimonas caeni]MDK2124203.1 hypothetical protein [Parachitinimonas caeni]